MGDESQINVHALDGIDFDLKRGFKLFGKKRYRDAIFSLERVLSYIASFDLKNIPEIERIYSCLGRSYLAIGKSNEALDKLSVAYGFFHGKESGSETQTDKEVFKETLRAYSEALSKEGQNDRAREIEEELKEFERN